MMGEGIDPSLGVGFVGEKKEESLIWELSSKVEYMGVVFEMVCLH